MLLMRSRIDVALQAIRGPRRTAADLLQGINGDGPSETHRALVRPVHPGTL